MSSLEGWRSTIELHPRTANSEYLCLSISRIYEGFNEFYWGKQDSNLRRLSHQIYSLAHLATLEFPRSLAPAIFPFRPGTEGVAPRVWKLAEGLEPTTPGLQNRSSAN